jgi:hypothetical protein
MRGEVSGQQGMFSYAGLEQRIPVEHPAAVFTRGDE